MRFSKGRGVGVCRAAFLIALAVVLTLNSSILAQAPEITCPGPVELTLEDLGEVCLELVITGADSVDAGTASWTNDTLCFTIDVPISDTITVIAVDTASGLADTCEVAVSFPGVTTKAGTIDGETWTAAESPYCVIGDLSVGALDILPGASVVFYGNYQMEVTGYLRASGSALDSIIFTIAPSVPRWRGLYYNQATQSSNLKYCVVEGSGSRAVNVHNCVLNVDNCSVRNNTGGGICSDVSLDVADCYIGNNSMEQDANLYGAGICITGTSRIVNCQIVGNSLRAIRSGDAYGYGGGIYVNGTALISGCLIKGNSTYARGGGVSSPYGYRYVYSKGGGVYATGDITIHNCIIREGSSWADIPSYHGVRVVGGSGICVGSGTAVIDNNTIYLNDREGLRRDGGAVSLKNSILWENDVAELAGTISYEYCCIQGADTTAPNLLHLIAANPNFWSADSLTLRSTSDCIDTGHPDYMYNDLENPGDLGNALWPSLGTVRNDMGAYGGPGALVWLDFPAVFPPAAVDTSLCELGGSICVPVGVINADLVEVTGATWTDDTLCFTADTSGTYIYTVTATNDSGSVAANVTVNVMLDIPLEVSPRDLEFATTDTATVLPDPQWIHISSTCDSGAADWSLHVPTNATWLEVDKTSGTNPDSVQVSITDNSLVPGIYTTSLEFTDNNGLNEPMTVGITLFVESGVDVGDATTKPGNSFSVPVTFFTAEALDDFTIPLKFGTTQPGEVRIDSIQINNTLVDTVITSDDSTYIVWRPMQPPPLPDSALELGRIFVTASASAQGEVFDIDTTTTTINEVSYRYEFVKAGGDTTVPYFSSGHIVIGDKKLELGNVVCPQGGTRGVPVIATGIRDVAGVQLQVSYDADIVRAGDEIATSDLFTLTKNDADGVISVIWADPSHPVTLADGDTLMTFWFTAMGNVGDSSLIAWTLENMLGRADGTPITGIEYYNGSVVVDSGTGTLAGKITYYKDADPMSAIPVELTDDASAWDTTAQNGWFEFEGLNQGDYTVTPICDAEAGGLNVIDIIQVLNYLAANIDFSPYNMLAADVNEDSTVSIADAVLGMRDIIRLQPLPCGTWKFVERDFAIDTGNWFGAPEDISVTLGPVSLMDLHFLAIRMGDVDSVTGSPASARGKTIDSDEADVAFAFGTASAADDGTIVISITMSGDNPVAGVELHLGYDREGVRLTEATSESLKGCLIHSDEDGLHLVWADINAPVTPAQGMEIASLRFVIDGEEDESVGLTFGEPVAADSRGHQYTVSVSDAASIETEGLAVPDRFDLGQNYPNPFNPSTIMSFSLPVDTDVRLDIFNVLGQKVITLVDGPQPAGEHSVEWHSTNGDGQKVASGVYFYRLKTEQYTASRKMILLK